MKKTICFLLCILSQLISADEVLLCKPEMTIVGLACRTSNASALQDIPAHWIKFYSSQIDKKISHKKNDEIIALYCDYEGDYTQPYTLVIGYQVEDASNLSEELVAKTVPAAVYTKFTAEGSFPESLISTWQKIWTSNFPRAYTGDFEIYGDAFRNANKQVDVYISIQD